MKHTADKKEPALRLQAAAPVLLLVRFLLSFPDGLSELLAQRFRNSLIFSSATTLTAWTS